jgi:hypothetical protein
LLPERLNLFPENPALNQRFMSRFFSGNYSLHLFGIPLFFLIGYFYLMAVNGPFFLSRIDPDYVYLLNGMNCAVFHFDRIGHLDHPGTPFQVFIGICIHVINLFSGQGEIVEDVLGRPEHYLKYISHILAFLFAGLLWWAGKAGEDITGRTGALLWQTTPFISSVIPDLSVRMMPDRFGFMLVFLMLILMVKISLTKTARPALLVALSGIVCGLAIASKINFLPVLILPLIVLPKRVLLLLSTGLGFLIGISPVIDRFDHFSNFMSKIIHHDGIYGSGSEQIFNAGILWNNLKILAQANPALVILVAGCFVTLLLIGRIPEKKPSLQRFFLGFCLVAIVTILMVIKHYKNYYLAPVLVMLGTVFFYGYITWRKTPVQWVLLIAALIFSLISFNHLWRFAAARKVEIAERKTMLTIVDEQRAGDGYFLIKPEWLWGPAREYGLIFGLSYVRHRDRYSEPVDRLFDRVLSYEGSGNPLRRMRVSAIDEKELHQPGTRIFMVDQKGRSAGDMISYLQERYHYTIADSVNLNSEELLIEMMLSKVPGENRDN